MENKKKKIVVFTGSGVSAESGISTFRQAADALWEQYDIKTVCTHQAWETNSDYVNGFYNMLRVKYKDVVPNNAHKIIAELEKDYDVTVITQNVDNLHEKAGSTNIIHLHGEIMKCCSDIDVENSDYWVELPKDGFGETGLEIPEGYETPDGGLLRPYIVFFGENVPNIEKAAEVVQDADVFICVGSSLTVYPAAGLVLAFDTFTKPVFIVDPGDIDLDFSDPWFGDAQPVGIQNIKHIKKIASEGMKDVVEELNKL